MAKDNILEQIFSPIGQGIRGMARGLFPGAAKAADLDTKRIKSLLESEAGRTLMNKARAAAMDRGEGLYGGRGGESSIDEIIKLAAAGDKTGDDKAESFFYGEANKLIKQYKAKGEGFVGPPAPTKKTQTSAAEYFQPQDETDVFTELGQKTSNKYFPAGNEWLRTKEVPEVFNEIGQTPKTFPQLGIESIADQATLQEMEKALPEVDMKSEYEQDPEMMKKLMELWRGKKLNKSNLHKAFSMIQQNAQQALGIA